VAVNTRQDIFAARMAEWKRCRDAVAGTDAVHDAGTEYLPRLGGQGYVNQTVPGIGTWQVDEYEAYNQRANWFNASKAAVKEMLGAILRTPPVPDMPEPMKPHLDDITLTGESAESFVQRLASEVITVGFFGVLVDLPAPERPEDWIIRRATVPSRPYWTGYRAEQILRIVPVNRDGIWVLGQVVLEECTIEQGDDEFEDVEVTRWRVLQLDAAGYLVVRRFEKLPGVAHPVELDTLQPEVRQQRMQGIPFVTFGPTSLMPVPELSPILDLVDINFSHYRTSADLEAALHMLAVPTPYAAGVDNIDKELRLGFNVAYTSTNPNFKIAYAEFSGAGLGELRGALEHKEAQMDAIRARLMARQKGGVESAEAIRLRTSGEQNVLMTLSHTLSAGLSRLLQYHAAWMGLRNVVATYEVNDDFVEASWSPMEQSEHRADVQAGLISYETYYYLRQKGELTRPDISSEEERAAIEAERPLSGEIELPLDDEDEAADDEDVA
jgi:hypothetical protein